MESLNSCINELQQQADAQRMELEDAHDGYIESQREQSRLQEELSVKEEALRETRIQNIHEIGEMKRAQELQVDEFSVQKMREIHETIQRRHGDFKKWNRITVADCLRSQSISKYSKFSFNAELRQTLAT